MKPPVLFIVLSILFAVSPLLPLVLAQVITQLFDCKLHEGFANPCVVFGIDMGETLYIAAVLPWLGLITLPTGALLVLIGLIWLAIVFIKRRQESRHE